MLSKFFASAKVQIMVVVAIVVVVALTVLPAVVVLADPLPGGH